MKRLVLITVLFATGIAKAQSAEYPGPTILSRGLGTAFQGGGDLLRLKPYLSLTGNYQTGLTPVSVDAKGVIPNDEDYGGTLGVGMIGYHNWRRTVLGIDYRGTVNHYAKNKYYDGSDHTLILGVTHQPTRNLSFSLREAAGSFSRSNGYVGASTFFDPGYAGVPANELFDGRTNYMSTMGDLTYMHGPRLSFNIGGSGMIVRRRSTALVGVTGWSGRADVAYRVGRSVTIGADYNFTHYEFTKAFGASDIHTVAVDVSVRLGRSWDLGLRGGGARIETLGLQRVGVDPIIAAIIGRTTGIEAVYRMNYLPAGQVKLARVFRRSSITFQYENGVNPGNGLYLTSRMNSGAIDYSHTAAERWNFGIGAGYDTYSSMTQSIGKYQGYRGGGGVTCKLTRWLHMVARYDARRYSVTESPLRRLQHTASLGVAFSPGEVPLSLW